MKKIENGEIDVPDKSYKSIPQLTVKLPEATPEAFHMVLNYIYTDRIDPTEKGKNITSRQQINISKQYKLKIFCIIV